MKTPRLIRLSRQERFVALFVGGLTLSVCFTPYWSVHLRNAFFRWDDAGGTRLLRLGPLTLAWRRGA